MRPFLILLASRRAGAPTEMAVSECQPGLGTGDLPDREFVPVRSP